MWTGESCRGPELKLCQCYVSLGSPTPLVQLQHGNTGRASFRFLVLLFFKWSGWCFSPQTLRSSHAGGLQPTEEPDLSRTWDCTPLPLAGKPATCPRRLHGLCSYLLLLAYSLTQQLRAAAAQSYLDAERGHRGQSSAGAAPPEGSTVQASRGLSDTAECRWPTSVHTWPLLGPGPPLSWQLEHPEEEEDRPLLNHLWVQEEISREIVSNTLT